MLRFRFRLWARIAVTLAINLVLLGGLTAALLALQARQGVGSNLLAPARERIRELGWMVEQEFPGKPPAERTAWLAEVQKPYGVVLAVYEDTGRLVAGPDLHAPAAVMARIRADRQTRGARGARQEPPPGTAVPGPQGQRPPRPGPPPMFLIREDHPPRYWFGYDFPILLNPNHPPVRHTLTAVAPSVFGTAMFVDWTPWLTGAGVAFLATVLCWIPLIRHVTGALGKIRIASGEIAEGRFDMPVAVASRDELGDLAESVARMAGQLARLVHGQKRFLADVAHELCAPLSRIQLSAGILEQNTAESETAVVRRLAEDVGHMSALVGDLLSFTKGSVRRPQPVPVLLEEVLRVAVERERAAGITVEVNAGLRVLADPEYLGRAAGNLIRNAVRYAGHAGPIRLAAVRNGSKVRLTVEDSGPGLPESELEAVFSPFHTPDTARTPGTGGVGLGLAIVQGCVAACGGTVHCRNRKPHGLEVIVELDAA